MNTWNKYRKKPVVISAAQLTEENAAELFCDLQHLGAALNIRKDKATGVTTLVIRTLEGDMTANCGDYIIRGINGEHYPCKPDIFAKTYERASHEVQNL